MKFTQVVNKATERYRGKVYDFTVEQSHSYNVDGLAVHNSGAGSLVNYLLGITKVDPLKYDLIFERFLNPDRGHMPDIDSDFGPSKSSMVFDHLNELYGEEKCCNIITFNLSQARLILRDVARVFEVPQAEVDAVSKVVDDGAKTFDEVMAAPKIQEFFKKYPEVPRHCRRLFGIPRHTGQHPAGIAVLPFPVVDVIPTQRAKDTTAGNVYQLAQWPKEACEEAGALKLDVLRLADLELLDSQVRLIAEYYGFTFSLADVPLDDEATWDLLCRGDTFHVFQFESPIGRRVLAQVRPRDLDDLAACSAFIRPGASGIEAFVEAKRNPSKRRLYHPRLDALLAKTHGAIVFQEDILNLISTLLGISFGRADIYRRALEKPDKPKNKPLVAEFKDLCVTEGVRQGFPVEVCERVLRDIIDNSGYSFNKSHAVTYSLISYWSAWIKTHFAPAFYASLVNEVESEQLNELLTEARRVGVAVLPPHLNRSGKGGLLERREGGWGLRVGLGVINGFGDKTIDAVLAERDKGEFTSVNDVARRAPKAIADPVVSIGALDGLPVELETPALRDSGLDLERLNCRTETRVIRGEDGEEAERTLLYLSPAQLRAWFRHYLPISRETIKYERRYVVSRDYVKGAVLDEYEGVLEFDKEGLVVVYEHDLPRLGLTPGSEGVSGTSRTKVTEFSTAYDKPLRALVLGFEDVVGAKEDAVVTYVQQMEAYKTAFVPHPLQGVAEHVPVLAELNSERYVVVGGVVTSVTERKASTGKPFYDVGLITPHEATVLRFWSDVYAQCKAYLFKGALVKVGGTYNPKYRSLTVMSGKFRLLSLDDSGELVERACN